MQLRHLALRPLAAIALISSVASAQSASRVSFGILLGGTAAKFTNVDVSSGDLLGGNSTLKNRMGFVAGIYANRSLSGRLSFQPEVHYVQKGALFAIDASTSVPASDVSINLSYIEVPLLLRLDFGSTEGWRPFLTAGPTAALRVGCDGTSKIRGVKTTVQCDNFGDGTEEDGGFTKTDFGGSVGAGIAGTVGGGKVFAQLRYGRGLSSIITGGSGIAEAPKTSMLSLVFGVGK